MSDDFFSITIDDDILCGVVLRQDAEQSVITGWGSIETGGHLHTHNFTDLMEKVGMTGGDCRVSLVSKNFLFNNVSFPFSDRRKIQDVLPFELEERLPVSVDDVITDAVCYKVDEDRTDVIAAMARRDFLSKMLAMLQEAGLDPDIVSVSGVDAAIRLIQQDKNLADFVFLEMEGRWVTMILVQNARLVLIRPIAWDFARFQSPSSSHKALQGDFQYQSVSYDCLVTSIKQTMRATVGDVMSSPIYISGSLAGLSNLPDSLGRSFPVEIRKFDLQEKMSIPRHAAGGSEDWVPEQMNQALALALRSGKETKGFNFRKGEYERKKAMGRFLAPGAGSRLVIMASVLLILCFLGYDFVSHKIEERRLNMRIETIFSSMLPRAGRMVDPVGQALVELKRIRKNSGLGSGYGYKVLDLLTEISGRIPASLRVRLTQMVMDDRGVLLKGRTDTFNAVDMIKKELEQSPLFHSVTITSANLASKGDGIHFDMRIQLNKS